MEKIKMSKTIKKPQLVAGLGFLHNMGFDEAKEAFKGILVDELVDRIIKKYNILAPDNCALCNNIYDCYNNDLGATCFLCDKMMCQDCCPEISQEKGINKTIFHICLKCSKPNLDKTGNKKSPEVEVTEKVMEEGDPNSQEEENIDTNEDDNDEEDGFTKVKAKPRKNASKSIQKVNEEVDICRFHILNKCKHGWKGEGCDFTHKKVCYKWMRGGSKSCNRKGDCKFFHPKLCNKWIKKGAEGCNMKHKCEFIHPAICKDNEKDGICSRDNCKFFNATNSILQSSNKETKNPGSSNKIEKISEENPGSSNKMVNGKVTGTKSPLESQGFPQSEPQSDPGPGMEAMMSCLVDLVSQIKSLTLATQAQTRQNQTWGFQYPQNQWGPV